MGGQERIMMTAIKGARVYSLSGRKSFASRLQPSKLKALRTDEEYIRRIDLIQDVNFKTAAARIKATQDGDYLIVSGSTSVLLRQLQTGPRHIVDPHFRVITGQIHNADIVFPCHFKFGANQLVSFSTYKGQSEDVDKSISRQDEDPFDTLTDRIPERPVSVAEGASYGLVILAGLAVAAAAAYAVFKELIFEPKEYKIFNTALDRVQHDSQVTLRIGTPITGYGQESRNRAARQRISNRNWIDEDGIEHVEVVFFIRGAQGAGKVHSEMFKDKADKKWKFTYLIVDILTPTPVRLMLESYVPT